MIGAAAFSGSVTKTVAPAIMVLELTGQSSHMVPVFLGVLIALSVFSIQSMGIFDVVLEFKNLPYIPTLGSVEAYYLKAVDIMQKNFLFLTKDATLQDLPIIIQKIKTSNMLIPVVESKQKKYFPDNLLV